MYVYAVQLVLRLHSLSAAHRNGESLAIKKKKNHQTPDANDTSDGCRVDCGAQRRTNGYAWARQSPLLPANTISSFLF